MAQLAQDATEFCHTSQDSVGPWNHNVLCTLAGDLRPNKIPTLCFPVGFEGARHDHSKTSNVNYTAMHCGAACCHSCSLMSQLLLDAPQWSARPLSVPQPRQTVRRYALCVHDAQPRQMRRRPTQPGSPSFHLFLGAARWVLPMPVC